MSSLLLPGRKNFESDLFISQISKERPKFRYTFFEIVSFLTHLSTYKQPKCCQEAARPLENVKIPKIQRQIPAFPLEVFPL